MSCVLAVRKEDALHQKGCQDVDKVLFVPLRLPSSHKIMSIIPNSQRDSPTRVLVLGLLRLVSFPPTIYESIFTIDLSSVIERIAVLRVTL